MKLLFSVMLFLPWYVLSATSSASELKEFRNNAMDVIDNPYCRGQFKRYLTKKSPKAFIYVPRKKDQTAYCKLALNKLASEKGLEKFIERCEKRRKKAKKNKFIASCQLFARDNELLKSRADFGLKPPKKDIFYITERYDVDELKVAINAGADINQQNEFGFTPLLIATKENNLEHVKYLISQGADFKIKNINGNDALILATKENNVDIFKYLLLQGADYNVTSPKTKRQAIHIAARQGFLNIMEILLNKGVDINKPSALGESPLMLAIQSHFKPVVKYVIERGADINAKDTSGKTPLDYARKYKNNRIIDYLIEKGAKSSDELKI